MKQYEPAMYVEGKTLGDGWSCRINRLEKAGGSVAYAVLLIQDNRKEGRDNTYLWLADFPTIEAAREGADLLLARWRHTEPTVKSGAIW